MSLLHVIKFSPIEYTYEYAISLPQEILLKWAVNSYNEDCILFNKKDKNENLFTDLVDGILHKDKSEIIWFVGSVEIVNRSKAEKILIKILEEYDD